MGRIMQPIRDIEMVDKMKRLLKQKDMRNWMLWVLGINTGLRISDLLPIRVKDVLGVDYLVVREKKTKKHRRILLNEELKDEIRHYVNYYDWLTPDDLLFYSFHYSNVDGQRPISSVQAYRIMRDAGAELGLIPSGRIRCVKPSGITFISKQRTLRSFV